MPNRIRSRRENKIYVDYIRTESGNLWTSPVNDPDVALNLFGISLDERVFDVVHALYHVTEAKPEALEMIASLWRPIRMSDGTSMVQIQEWNTATVNALQNHGIGNTATQEHIACVKECWRFPLYDLDLGMREVSKKEITSILEAEEEAFWRSVI